MRCQGFAMTWTDQGYDVRCGVSRLSESASGAQPTKLGSATA
jgi:hypothetical protein